MIHIYLAATVVAVFAMYWCGGGNRTRAEEERVMFQRAASWQRERAELHLNVQRERSEQVRAIGASIQGAIQGICDVVGTIFNGREQTARVLARINLRRDQDTNKYNTARWAELVRLSVEYGPSLLKVLMWGAGAGLKAVGVL